MKIITFEEKDALALLDQMELKMQEMIRRGEPVGAEEAHRSFRYVVVVWLQQQGASCTR